MLKIGIFGNRTINDEEVVKNLFANWLAENLPEYEDYIILHGGAAGPQEVLADPVKSVLFKPWHMVWSKIEFDPILFYMRNKQIVDNSDHVLIFSNGEKDAEVYKVINLCERKNIQHTIINVPVLAGE